ncbi:hypothetical protein ACI2K4_01630 [Micromonospora sp. NPDC050397]|uniref:hypothetical protein n=1 Tax=Micromonospora sp. NPDC050397 TaxID=3364279 RepID=UPI003851105E
MLTEYQRELRERFLSAPVMPPPGAWRPVLDRPVPVGGLVGIGFAVDPAGDDLVLVVSHDGHGLLHARTGARIARDRAPDSESAYPDAAPDLTCPGLGPIAGTRVRIAGLFGGGLHTTAEDGWTVDVVSPDWPNHRVVLSTDGGLCRGPVGEKWWHIFHADYSELRAVGFSPSGRTLAVATSSDLMLWSRSVTPDPANRRR